MNRRASFLAFHAIVKAAEVSAVSHHPSLCVRRGGGGTSASTASRITMVKESAISEILLGCKGRSGSLEMICAVEWVRAVCARLGGKVVAVVLESLTY